MKLFCMITFSNFLIYLKIGRKLLFKSERIKKEENSYVHTRPKVQLYPVLSVFSSRSKYVTEL